MAARYSPRRMRAKPSAYAASGSSGALVVSSPSRASTESGAAAASQPSRPAVILSIAASTALLSAGSAGIASARSRSPSTNAVFWAAAGLDRKTMAAHHDATRVTAFSSAHSARYSPPLEHGPSSRADDTRARICRQVDVGSAFSGPSGHG